MSGRILTLLICWPRFGPVGETRPSGGARRSPAQRSLWRKERVSDRRRGYLIVAMTVGLTLPTVNEVPEYFPAVVLWGFRIASIGAQLITWATIRLVFDALTERSNCRLPTIKTPARPPHDKLSVPIAGLRLCHNSVVRIER